MSRPKRKTPLRVASQLKAIRAFPAKTNELKKAEREAARVERQRLKTEARELKVRENAAQLVDLRQKPKPPVAVAPPPPKELLSPYVPKQFKCGPDGRPVPMEREPPPPAPSTSSPFAGCTLIETRYARDKKIEFWQKPGGGGIIENWVSLVPETGWQPAGIHGRRPTRAQLAARHHQREAPANVPRPGAGAVAPSPQWGTGVDPMHSSTGVRQDPGGISTLWNRTLKDL